MRNQILWLTKLDLKTKQNLNEKQRCFSLWFSMVWSGIFAQILVVLEFLGKIICQDIGKKSRIIQDYPESKPKTPSSGITCNSQMVLHESFLWIFSSVWDNDVSSLKIRFCVFLSQWVSWRLSRWTVCSVPIWSKFNSSVKPHRLSFYSILRTYMYWN